MCLCQGKLFAEMKSRISEVDSSVPALDGPYAYYSRYAAGNEHPIYSRVDRTDVEKWEARAPPPPSYLEILGIRYTHIRTCSEILGIFMLYALIIFINA